MFEIISWDTSEVLDTAEGINEARRKCRSLGYLTAIGTVDLSAERWFAPVAYVSNGHGVVYNPRFQNPNWVKPGPVTN